MKKKVAPAAAEDSTKGDNGASDGKILMAN